MCEAPGSVVTLLCSGIQLYSAERRIADCILADVKRASMCTSAELARLSCSSEATITRLCHKLGFENYRKFQLALARDAMEQQEAQRMRDEGQDELHQALLNILANREEELRATIQAIDTRQLRQILSLLRSCEVMEVVSEGGGLPVAFDASIRFSHLGKRCVSSAVHEKNLAFAQTLTPNAACPPFVLVSVYLPGLRQEVFAEFGDGILVGHTRNVIADHALRLFPFIKHGEVFFRQKLNVVFVESKELPDHCLSLHFLTLGNWICVYMIEHKMAQLKHGFLNIC